MKKGQSSVEFLLLVAFGTLIFVVFFAVIQDRILVANNEQTSQDLDRVNKMISSEINLAYRFGNGYEREFWMPTYVRGLSYNASIRDNRTLVTNASTVTNLYFFDYPVYGQLKTGKNIVLGLYNSVYLNTDLNDVLTIKIDGDGRDWEALQDWYDISPIQDLENDEYVPFFPAYFSWDLKSLMIWNDKNNIYFRIELYDDTISDYDAVLGLNVVDILVLLDTKSGGYKSYNPNKIATDLEVDYLVSDKNVIIDRTDSLRVSDYSSSRDPLSHTGSTSEFLFQGSFTSSTPFKYRFIDSSTMEMSVSLSKIGLLPDDTIRYVVVARDNQTKIIDYLPGNYEDFSGGYYTIQNR